MSSRSHPFRAVPLVASVAAVCLLLAAAGAWAGEQPIPTAGPSVSWLEEVPFADVLAQAKAQGKPVMIDFFAVWCGPCKWLDKNVYVHPAVVEESKGWVNFKVDAEKGEGLELASRFHIVNYPTMVFLSSAGEETDRFLGTRPPEAFAQKMQDVRNGVGTVADLKRRVEAAPDDLELRRQLAEVLTFQAAPDADAQLVKLVAADSDNAKGVGAWAMLQRGDLAFRQQDYATAIARTEEAWNRFPDNPATAEVAVESLALYYRKNNNLDKVVELERRILKRAPDDPKALNRFAWNVAKTGLALDEALTAAQKGVELSQRDPGIVDTLAEVHYRRGEHDQAIALMQECIQKQPEDTYFKEQLEKFTKAKQGA
jgi:thiol-disulfide isomerase/thioredoxin/lipopolysaccharide biosynthesis regulator YciM